MAPRNLNIRTTDALWADLKTIRQFLQREHGKASVTDAVKRSLQLIAQMIRNGLDPNGPLAPPEFATLDELQDMERRIRERKLALALEELRKTPTRNLKARIDELLSRPGSDLERETKLPSLVLELMGREREGDDS